METHNVHYENENENEDVAIQTDEVELELVDEEDAVQAMAYHIAQCVNVRPESKTATPEDMRAILFDALSRRHHTYRSVYSYSNLASLAYATCGSYCWSWRMARRMGTSYVLLPLVRRYLKKKVGLA